MNQHLSHGFFRVTTWLLFGLLVTPTVLPRSALIRTKEGVAATSPDDQSDLSELKIFFKLANGKLQVNRETSKLNSSERFKSRLSPNLRQKEVEKTLFDDGEFCGDRFSSG